MIYCVEDERNIRELLIYTLETTGFKARGFGNGAELMQALKEEIPELILLDIMLPAIGSVPFAAGLPCGKIVLSVAVMAIIITAPLGAFGMDLTYKKILTREK